MIRLLLLLLLAGQVISTDPAEITTVAGNRPDPAAFPNVPKILESQLREFDWSAEIVWAPEPQASRVVIRSCQPVNRLVAAGKEDNTGENYRISIRNVQLFPAGAPAVVTEGGQTTVTQKTVLVCYLQVDLGNRSWVLSLPKKDVPLSYRMTK